MNKQILHNDSNLITNVMPFLLLTVGVKYNLFFIFGFTYILHNTNMLGTKL